MPYHDTCCQEDCCRPDAGDASPVTVLTTTRTSRTERTCGTCQGAILPGEQYARHFLPPDAEHDTSMTITEHASAGTCYVIMNQEQETDERA